MNAKLNSLFTEIIDKVENIYNYELKDYSVIFILRILNNLLTTDKYFKLEEKPLAIQYLEAVQDNTLKKSSKLMDVGDLALLSATLFQEHMTKKEIIDIDYFLALSFSAFMNLRDLALKEGVIESIQSVLEDFELINNTMLEIGANINLVNVSDVKKLLKRYDLSRMDFYKRRLLSFSLFCNDYKCGLN